MKFNKRKIKKIILIVLAVILLFFVYLNAYLMIKYNVLPTKFLIIYFILFLVIPLIIAYFSIFVNTRKVLKSILLFFEVLYIILLCLSFVYLNRTFNFIDDFTNQYGYETKNYYVLVLDNSEYKDIKDLKDKTIGYTKNLDDSINNAMEKLDTKVSLEHLEYNNFMEVIESLQNNEVDSMLIIDSFYEMLTEDDEAIKESVKVIYDFSIREKVEEIKKDVDVTKETFNIYVSGIDSYGSVTDKTRSDVNIVMSVNPVTKKILMINIPRDYYVELDNIGQKDKLTHAGMYGVDMSIKTIENLLDIDINYYVKVNYKALVELVDALGGVEVYSKYDFYSTDYHYHFKKGYNDVNGKEALDFVRTRKAFLEGDRARGENQQAMIEAIIKKAASPSILMKYNAILDSLEGSFTTNISTDKIMDVVKMQLDKMSNWKIESISLDGDDGYGFTYTFPGQELYVMIPKEETINEAKQQLDAIK